MKQWTAVLLVERADVDAVFLEGENFPDALVTYFDTLEANGVDLANYEVAAVFEGHHKELMGVGSLVSHLAVVEPKE